MHFRQTLSNFILFICGDAAIKRILRFLNRLLNPGRDIRIQLQGQTIYASTLDRLIVLLLKKFALVEEYENKFFQSIVKPGMIIADVGANIGWYTTMASRLVGDSGKVFAFEPDPENFRLLCKNVSVNQCKNVEAFDWAVSDRTGEIQLFFCEENRGDHRIYESGDGRKKIGIHAISLDDFFKNALRVDMIKIDVQGAERLVFSGMKKIIENNPQLSVIMEFCPAYLRICDTSPDHFLREMESSGFSIYLINEDEERIELINKDKLIKECIGQRAVNLFLKIQSHPH